MRTLFTAILMSVLVNAGAATINAPPPVVFSVEPEENCRLVYLRIVPETPNQPASNLFGLRMHIANNSTNEVQLTNIRIVFTFANHTVLGKQFNTNLTIAGSGDTTLYLEPEQSIQLPEPAPVSAEIQLYFDGYLLPRMVQRALAPYEGPADETYLFPASESDLGPNQYFSHVDPHSGGSQFFGYDFHVQEWNGNSFSSVKWGGSSGVNEDRVGWNMPIYAMADGVVIKALTGFENNPAPGKRVIQRMGDHTGAAITEVKVTALAANRAASVIRLPSGNMKITMWDVLDYGRQVIEKGSVQAEIVHDLAVDALSSSRLVTAVRTAGGDLRVIVWETLDGGATVSRRGEQDAGPVEEVSLITISSRRFATAVRAQRGVFRLILWEVSSDGLTLSQLSEASAGTASSISAIALSQTRLATAFRASEGTLKVIMWELLDDGATIDRRGEASADMIKQVVAIKTANPAFVTAMQTAGGDLKALGWDVSEDGEVVTQTLEVNAGQIQGLVGTAFDDDGFVTAVITEQGSFRNILWRPPKDGEPANFVRIGEREAGTTDRLSIDYMGEGLIFSGVRTESGELKVIAWWIGSGSGNSLFILHGDCRVIYAHFKDGSVNPSIAYPGAVVTKGQYLARMGNSGTSTGPHTHIHAERVSSFLSVQEIIQREAEGTLSLLGFRPIPFHCARAKRLSAVQPGEDPASTFSTMQGHGAYFAQFAIRPSWVAEMYVDGSSDCLAPTGRKQCTQVGEYSFGGPFHTVTQALTSPACMIDQLFIRGGTYKESVTFNRSMTVRSYEGIAIIRY